MFKIDAGPELETMVAIARRAGERAMALMPSAEGQSLDIEHKGPHDPVTGIDRELDGVICQALREAFPDAAVIAEESVPNSREEIAAQVMQSRVFFVDPIDGTRELIAGTGEFAVMIGLAIDGAAAAGVLCLPTEGVLFAGRVGQRAFTEAPDGRRRFLSVTPCSKFADARMMVSRSHRPALLGPLAKRLGFDKLVPCGSVGVKVARLLAEQAELYVHAGPGLKKWDTCAPEAVLAAAGGRFSNLDGAGIDYAAPELMVGRGIVATNGVLHPGVLSAIPWAERELARVSKA